MRTLFKKPICSLSAAAMLLTQIAAVAPARAADPSAAIDALFSRAEYVARVKGDQAAADRELLEGLNAQQITIGQLREFLVQDLNAQEVAEFDNGVMSAARASSPDAMSRAHVYSVAGSLAASLSEGGAHARGSRMSRAGSVLTICAGIFAAVQFIRHSMRCTEDYLCSREDFEEFRDDKREEAGSLQAKIDANNLRIADAQSRIDAGVISYPVVIDSKGTIATRRLDEYVTDLKIQNLDFVNKQTVLTRSIDWSVGAEKDVSEFRAAGKPYGYASLGLLTGGILWAVKAYND